MRALRHIAPYILIAAYMPLLVALTFHTHSEPHSAVADCPDCVHHIHHRAHLAEAVTMVHDCVYCHLTTSTYYASVQASLPLRSDIVVTVDTPLSDEYVSASSLSAAPRAPPLQ